MRFRWSSSVGIPLRRPGGGAKGWARCAVGGLGLALLPFMALTMVTEAPAVASGATLYAYATGAGTTACDTTTAECSLGAAISELVGGDTIILESPSTTPYVGNWVINTAVTSSGSPVTIEPASGSTAVLSGNNGSATGCTTTSCDAPILTIGGTKTNVVYVDLTGLVANGLTFEDADNLTPTPGSATETLGGAIDNTWGGVLSVTDTQFEDNTADFGGAINNASGDDAGAGTLTVTGSTFTDNHATIGDGGAINSAGGGSGATGTLTVTNSSFTDNTATGSTINKGDGGAIDNGDESTSSGTMTVSGSTFTGNTATVCGGAICNGANGGTGGTSATPNTVSGSTFANNSANGTNQTEGDGGAIDSADLGGHGYLTVSNSTFDDNLASADAPSANADGGAIDNGDNGGNGHLTVTGSTFDANTTNANSSGANANGGAIDNADDGGAGTVVVSTSTFDANQAENAYFGSHGGGIDNADDGGVGALTATASTFDANTVTSGTIYANDGSAIDNADYNGTSTTSVGDVAVAANIVNGTCDQKVLGTGTWTDGGYNVGPDATCDNGGTDDVGNASNLATELGPCRTTAVAPTPWSRQAATRPSGLSLRHLAR